MTNDDGVHAEGLHQLTDALRGVGEVIVVAPDREQSGASHAITLNRPLRIREIEKDWYSVDGTPTDCVNLAVLSLLEDRPPDMVISGINQGLNLGDDVTYSGTVNAAFEAHLLEIPAVAISQEMDGKPSFERAARFAHDLVTRLLEGSVPRDLLLNVNLPVSDHCGVRLTRLGRRVYEQVIVEKIDPRGRKYYWIGGEPQWERSKGTDHEAIIDGEVSITPLHLDLTDYSGLERHASLVETLHRVVRTGG